MVKKDKAIILVLTIASVFLVILLLITSSLEKSNNSKNVSKNSDNPYSSEVEMVDLVKLESQYKESTKKLYVDSLNLFKQTSISLESIRQVKKTLLSLTVPKEFKKLHFDLVFALIKLENFVADGNESDKISGTEIIQQIGSDYVWISSDT